MIRNNQPGFTIVELLIVIVVIGILAAITIVAFNGVQDRARVSSVSSALSQAAKKLAVYQVDNPDVYPADKTALEALGIKDSTSVTYQYTRTSSVPNTYCITATTATTSYKISNTNTTPSAGGCAGHGVGGTPAIVNLSPNPSFETNTTGYNSAGGNGASLSASTAYAKNGTSSLQATWAAAGSGLVESAISGVNAAAVTGSAPYTVSAHLLQSVGVTRNVQLNINWFTSAGAYISQSPGSGQVSTSGSWTRYSTTATSPATAAYASIQISFGAVAINDRFNVDSVMVTSGSTLHTYADGTSANWAWNGTTNNSPSTGPAL